MCQTRRRLHPSAAKGSDDPKLTRKRERGKLTLGMSKEVEISADASSMFPGFRFSPTDEELILYYLKNKVEGLEKSVEVIAEVDICQFEPWDLPAKSIIKSDHEWFFFSRRGKKYPTGSQIRRATEVGYWKATGKERPVKSGLDIIGTKRTLVFHIGRAPKGERTEWIIHECRMLSQEFLVICGLRRKSDFRGKPPRSEPSSLIGNSNASASCSNKSSSSQVGDASATDDRMRNEVMDV